MATLLVKTREKSCGGVPFVPEGRQSEGVIAMWKSKFAGHLAYAVFRSAPVRWRWEHGTERVSSTGVS